MTATAPWTVVQLLPEMQAGGAERSTLEIGRALVAHGHRSVVISAGGRLVEQLVAEGSEHHTLAIAKKSLLTLLQIRPLRRLLDGLNPDLLHVRSRLPAWLAHFAASRSMPASVSTVHGLNSVSRYSAILTRAERVIAVSQTSANHLQENYRRLDLSRLRVIPRGMSADDFPHQFQPSDAWISDFRSEFPQLAGEKLLTLPGRGTRLKGHTTALELLAAVRGRGVDARLLLLGADQPGRERYLDELRRRAGELGLEGCWLATTSRSDVREVYAVSDLVLQLSDRPESFGRTVAEALHQGRPVLGWDLGGVGEQLRRSYPPGVVEFSDQSMLVQRACGLLSDPQLEAIDRASIPTIEAMQEATLAVYAEVVEANPDVS